MLRIKSHPVYTHLWCVVGPSMYDAGVTTVWYGPDTLAACVEARRSLRGVAS